jgi:pimeloyl-ACP methyl ester carboxylesterase
MESGKRFNGKVRKWGMAAGLLILVFLMVYPVSHAVFAVQLALSLQKLAAGTDNRVEGVRETQVQRRLAGRDLDALLYYPEQSPPDSAIILVAGLSELGCRHPRLVALSRLLAEKGLLVVTPDIREFREFKISPEPISQMLFWHSQIPALEGGAQVKTIGFAGISFSGTLAMIAAAKPEIRDKVGFLVAIGPYSNLLRCTRGWFAAGPITVTGNYYPTRFYARWIGMLAAVDMVQSASDRLFLDRALHSLLLQKELPPAPVDLTAEGARWHALATMKENQSDPELSQSIEDYLVAHIYPQLDPENAVKSLQCPAFFIHGAYDDLIPAEESMELHRRVSDSHLLISPFLTHTHPTDKPLSLWQKTRAAVDTLVFSYSLSRAIRRI